MNCGHSLFNCGDNRTKMLFSVAPHYGHAS
jgi:hypothetical protein